MRFGLRRVFCVVSVFLLGALAVGIYIGEANPVVQAQEQTAKPISLKGLVASLKIGALAPTELIETIRKRGVSFEMTVSAERQLTQAGATSEIIFAARGNYRKVQSSNSPAQTVHVPPPTVITTPPAPTPVQNPIERAKSECEAGVAESCSQVATKAFLGWEIPRDLMMARAYYIKACDLKDGDSCGSAGNSYYFEKRVPHDTSLAITYARRGCDMGSASSCNMLQIIQFTEMEQQRLNQLNQMNQYNVPIF